MVKLNSLTRIKQFTCFQPPPGAAEDAKAAREGQEGVAAANEETDVAEEQGDGSQYAAVGESSDSKQRQRCTLFGYLCNTKSLTLKIFAGEHLIYGIIQQ